SLDAASVSALWQHRSDRAISLMGGLNGLERIVEGSSRLPEGMAALLKREVCLNAHVTGIRTRKDGVEIEDLDSRRYRAAHAICTVPLTMLRRIGIEPALPSLQAEAIRDIPYGSMTCVYLTVRSRYWEEDGLPAGVWSNRTFSNVLPFTTDHGDYLWVIVKEPAYGQMGDEEIMQRTLAELKEIRPSTAGRLEPGAVMNWSSYPWMLGHTVYRRPGQIA